MQTEGILFGEMIPNEYRYTVLSAVFALFAPLIAVGPGIGELRGPLFTKAASLILGIQPELWSSMSRGDGSTTWALSFLAAAASFSSFFTSRQLSISCIRGPANARPFYTSIMAEQLFSPAAWYHLSWACPGQDRNTVCPSLDSRDLY